MLRAWARVDFRVDQNGQPWILEVNANPCLSPDAGFRAALQQAGIAFDEAIACILEDTLAQGCVICEGEKQPSLSAEVSESTDHYH